MTNEQNGANIHASIRAPQRVALALIAAFLGGGGFTWFASSGLPGAELALEVERSLLVKCEQRAYRLETKLIALEEWGAETLSTLPEMERIQASARLPYNIQGDY